MNLKDRMIVDEFKRERPNFLKLETVVSEILHKLVKENDILVNSIEHRVKKEDSLMGKLYRKGDSYHSLDDLTDLFGARIICYFGDGVDQVCRLIEQNFEVDWENSADKRTLLKADSFGYLSVHYICSLPENAGYPAEICGKRFEIQIRTILQHAWAAINHDLGYKSEFGVPRAVTREFARLAGLLELADDEFMRSRDHINAYADEIREKIIHNNADDVLLDMISLREYMKRNTSMRAFIDRLAAIEGSEIDELDPEGYIAQLRWLKVGTIGQLHRMLERNEEVAYELARNVLEGSELDLLASTAALRFVCRAELCTAGYSEEQMAEFIGLTVKQKDRASRQVKSLLRSYAEIRSKE